MGANYTVCCCLYYLKHSRPEKRAVLRMRTTAASRPPESTASEPSDSDAEEDSMFGGQVAGRTPPPNNRRSSEHLSVVTNVPREPGARRGSDSQLQDFISMRDQADKATEEWEKLNFDIHTLLYARREVRSRWKKILLEIGYQCEVDALLFVNKQSQFGQDQEHLDRATELLKQLLNNTSLFPPGTEHRSRYLYVMDRLVSLDSAEEFVKLAMKKYPKKEAWCK